MDWFKDFYDEFRMKMTFGSISDERTKQDVDFMIDVLDLPDGGKILDLFSGLGRHSIELSKRGYKTVPIEYNKEYLKLAQEKAKEKGVSVEFIQGDVRHVDFGAEYDAVIVMYHSFGVFSDEDDRKVLQKIYYALKKKGRFLIEIMSRDWLLKNFMEHEESEFNNVMIKSERKFDANTNRVNFIIKRYKGSEVITKKGSWRFYSADEITKILEDIGFKFIAGYNDLEKNPLTKDTRLVRLIYEK